MIDFLSSPSFRFFFLPLITVILTVVIKVCYRKESMQVLEREDFAIGPNLITTSLLILVSKISIVALAVKAQPKYLNMGMEIMVRLSIYLGIMLLILMILTTIVRRSGWQIDRNTGKNRLTAWIGIIWPDILGIIYLVFVYTTEIEFPKN